jgi:hypothetical protein
MVCAQAGSIDANWIYTTHIIYQLSAQCCMLYVTVADSPSPTQAVMCSLALPLTHSLAHYC